MKCWVQSLLHQHWEHCATVPSAEPTSTVQASCSEMYAKSLKAQYADKRESPLKPLLYSLCSFELISKEEYRLCSATFTCSKPKYFEQHPGQPFTWPTQVNGCVGCACLQGITRKAGPPTMCEYHNPASTNLKSIPSRPQSRHFFCACVWKKRKSDHGYAWSLWKNTSAVQQTRLLAEVQCAYA